MTHPKGHYCDYYSYNQLATGRHPRVAYMNLFMSSLFYLLGFGTNVNACLKECSIHLLKI